MKPLGFPVVLLRLVLCGLLIGGGYQSAFAQNKAGGHLIIKRSPVMGANVTLVIRIDGQIAGTVTRGRTFDGPLAPGRRHIVVSANRARGDWTATLDVRPGQTYAYLASYSVNRLVLEPTR
jgi:hypothetical protein